jgi:hypothetical protein
MAALLPMGPGLWMCRVRVEAAQVAWLRYTLEAHDGLAFMHSDGSGYVSLLTTESQSAALEALVADLARDGVVELLAPDPPSF